MNDRSANTALAQLRKAALSCTACPLWENATQTVFGEGDADAKAMLVGEQPGDQEDVSGRPFVGPAGRLLDRALVAAGVERSEVYVTNAVKHFKWEWQGKRRLHKKPTQREVSICCQQWLEREIHLIQPRVIVCLGATAAGALLGRGFRITTQRGRLLESTLAKYVFATVHPSYLLRLPDETQRAAAFASFVEDLRLIRRGIADEAAPV